jgi:hypothetical protein
VRLNTAFRVVYSCSLEKERERESLMRGFHADSIVEESVVSVPESYLLSVLESYILPMLESYLLSVFESYLLLLEGYVFYSLRIIYC